MPSGVYIRTKIDCGVGRPKGYVVSNETKEKIKQSMFGVKHTKERRKNQI